MNKQDAERITTEYLRAIYGFALKRCRNLQDAEDLSQEIALKIYCALQMRDDISDIQKYIWTVAHNCLVNYYRDHQKWSVGVSIEEISEQLPGSGDIASEVIQESEMTRVNREIAYLSKWQRKIVVAYYFENRRQADIAKDLHIPLGTVKWHLFEAKKELKRGMETMRTTKELQFNPIVFSEIGTNGIIGNNGTNRNYFKTALPQNIVYSVRKTAKTVNEIADELAVSPVYVESEAEVLEKNGFLTLESDRYLCSILSDEPTDEIIAHQNAMYEKAAGTFANELFDTLIRSELLNSKSILGGYTGEIPLNGGDQHDRNFLLWALIPFIAAQSGTNVIGKDISFEDVAIFRADGGYNICFATVENEEGKKARNYKSIQKAYGPYYREADSFNYFQFDSEWSGSRIDSAFLYKEQDYIRTIERLLTAKKISVEDKVFLAEYGLIKNIDDSNQLFRTALRCVWINDAQTVDKLVEIGDQIKEKHWNEFSEYIKRYTDAVLRDTPAHLRKVREYELQFTVFGDKRFITNCLCELVGNGKLTPPTEEQQSVSSILLLSQ